MFFLPSTVVPPLTALGSAPHRCTFSYMAPDDG